MKTKKSIQTYAIGQILLVVPVTCSMALVACSELTDISGTPSIKYQRALAREPQSGDNIFIGPATYSSQARGFEKPWPFGPEFNPQ